MSPLYTASRKIPAYILDEAPKRESVINLVRSQLARELADKILENMNLVAEESIGRQEVEFIARVHIDSENQKQREAVAPPLPREFVQQRWVQQPWIQQMLNEDQLAEERARHQWSGTKYLLSEEGETIMTTAFWNTGSQFTGEQSEIDKLPIAEVLVDGDIVAYRCAATCDGRYYEVDGERFGYKKDAVAYADKKGIPNSDIKSGYEPEPVDAALHNIAVTIDNIRNHFIYTEKLNPRLKIFLSGDRNFRYDLYAGYKANRKDQRKPHWLKECKQYLQDQFKAHKFEGFEADDLIGITVTVMRNSEPKIFIASNDKDFTQLGGEDVIQYDFTTGKLWAVTEDEAIRYFYKQILTGDKGDNIPGIPKVGNQTALKILSGCQEERDLYNATVLAYKDKFDVDSQAAEDMVLLRGQLLWLLREEGVAWEPPPPRNLNE